MGTELKVLSVLLLSHLSKEWVPLFHLTPNESEQIWKVMARLVNRTAGCQ